MSGGDSKQKFLFFSLLNSSTYDDGDSSCLEAACGKLADLPTQLAGGQVPSSVDAKTADRVWQSSSPSTSYAVLRDALLGLASMKGLPMDRSSSLIVYTKESELLHSASAMLHAMNEVSIQYNIPLSDNGGSFHHPGQFGAVLKGLLRSHPELPRRSADLMLQYGQEYRKHLVQCKTTLAGLTALRRACPEAYRVYGQVQAARHQAAAAMGGAAETFTGAPAGTPGLNCRNTGTRDIVQRYRELWLKRTAGNTAVLACGKSR